jgi:type I restriction enzyme S subunit
MKLIPLGQITDISTGKLDVNASAEDGLYPFFTCAAKPYRINEYAFDAEAVLIAGNGDLNVKYYEGKFNAYQRTYIVAPAKPLQPA